MPSTTETEYGEVRYHEFNGERYVTLEDHRVQTTNLCYRLDMLQRKLDDERDAKEQLEKQLASATDQLTADFVIKSAIRKLIS